MLIIARSMTFFLLHRIRILLHIANEILTQAGVLAQTVPFSRPIPKQYRVRSLTASPAPGPAWAELRFRRNGNRIRTVACGSTLMRAVVAIFPLLTLGCASITENSNSPESLNRLYLKDIHAGDLKKARQDLSREIRLHPRNVSVWNNLAYLDFKTGHYRQADGDLAQGLALHPGNTFLLENRARLCLARQENEKARTILLSLEAVRPWPKGFRLLFAIADLRTGRQEEARLLLYAILSDRPRDPLARVYLSGLKNETVHE